MNAIHHDIAAVIEAVNTQTIPAAASSVPGKSQPLVELPVVQLDLVGGGDVSHAFY